MKYILQLIITIILFLTPVWGYAKGETQAAPAAVLVETAPLQLQFFAKKITETGTLRANQGITVRPEVAGRITQIYFKSGAIVAAGTPLLQLNRDIIYAELQQSQAELELAKLNYARMKELFQSHTISKADFDDVASKLNVATAKVAQYQAELKQTLLVAPFAGKLGLSAVSVGDYLNVGQEVVSLQALDPIEVEFNVPEIYLTSVAVDQNIQITASAYPHQVFWGKIYAIDATVNVSNRTFAVRATIPNTQHKLLPGVFVEVNLNIGQTQASLVMPQIAAFYDTGKVYVYKVVGNKVVKTAITIGERDRANVVILSGLRVNDVIVTAGQLNLEDGATIRTTAAATAVAAKP